MNARCTTFLSSPNPGEGWVSASAILEMPHSQSGAQNKSWGGRIGSCARRCRSWQRMFDPGGEDWILLRAALICTNDRQRLAPSAKGYQTKCHDLHNLATSFFQQYPQIARERLCFGKGDKIKIHHEMMIKTTQHGSSACMIPLMSAREGIHAAAATAARSVRDSPRNH